MFKFHQIKISHSLMNTKENIKLLNWIDLVLLYKYTEHWTPIST